jgi:hypothetical protein
LKDSDEQLWDGCTNHNKSSVVAQVFTIKSDYGLSKAIYAKSLNGREAFYFKKNKLKENFYVAICMMKHPSLGYQKIDMFLKFYMLYYLKKI